MKRKIAATSDRLRVGTKPAIGEDRPQVDREAGVIRRYRVLQIGEALGHEMYIDAETLKAIKALGDKAGARGVKSRFTHPGLSSDGLGKLLGRSRDFVIEGDSVFADLHFARSARRTPNGDLAGYVMDLAEEDSKSFGASIVARGKKEPVLNADGARKKDKDGKNLLPLYRPTELFASDVVDDPAAARDGFLSVADVVDSELPDWHVRQAFDALDDLFRDSTNEVIQTRVDHFLNRYLSLRDKNMATQTAGDKTDSTKGDETQADLNKGGAEADAGKADTAKGADPNPAPAKSDLATATDAEAGRQNLSAADVEKIVEKKLSERTTQHAQIAALCNQAKCPKLASQFIAENLSVD
ncbi:MAG TPA: hypothetical protein VGJ26_07410, partial [Pirellulales bacterium]